MSFCMSVRATGLSAPHTKGTSPHVQKKKKNEIIRGQIKFGLFFACVYLEAGTGALPSLRLTCCCWKDLSLFLKREGSTKSHPLAKKASSPLRSGSRRNDVSLIIMVGAKTRGRPPVVAAGASVQQQSRTLSVCGTAQISSNQKF